MTVHRNLAEVSTRARLVPRRALLDQRNHEALLDQRNHRAPLDQRNHAPADRVADGRNSTPADRVGREERAAVSRSRHSPHRPRRGLDTCPTRSSPGTTRPAEPQGTTRPTETNTPAHRVTDGRNSPSADRVGREERAAVSRSRDRPRRPGRGLDTCPTRPSPGTTRPAEPQGATRPAGTRRPLIE